jgi:predicted transcriptional regulator
MTFLLESAQKEPFMLKDLERDLPKTKGIVSQTVKEVIQELVDDNLVDFDKIGGSNFFWAFPSKASKVVRPDFHWLISAFVV